MDEPGGASNDPELGLEAPALANRARAAEVVRVLRDVGLPVRLVEETMVGSADGELRGRSTDEFDASRPRDEDAPPRPAGVRVTIIEERVDGREPFDGTCVEWLTAEWVGQAGVEALKELLEIDEGFPDPLPAPIRRDGRFHEVMSGAIRAVLEYEGFTLRDDTDYRPRGLWVVDRSGSSPA